MPHHDDPVRLVTDDERRARLAVRHALAPSARVGSADAAVGAMTALHATEPATVYLSCWARVDGVRVDDVQRALHEERSVVKQLAMRRTLFVFPRDLLPAVWPSASARVAATERTRLAKDVVATGLAEDGNAWLDRARAGVLAVLAEAPDGLQAAQIRTAVPMIDVRVDSAGGRVLAASRVLTQLAATAHIVRGTNAGGWYTSRPRWTLMERWLGDVPTPVSSAEGYCTLVRRWLETFGPGIEDDLVWWLRSTRAVVRTALAELGAEQVALEGGGSGWLLPDDLDEAPDPGPWVALLPVLDPTTMGWKERDFYLGPHRDRLFDRNGNAGTTAWVDGRAIGCWVQDDAGRVQLRLLEDASAEGHAALVAEADRLSTWLDGFKVGTVYKSPAMR
jgi:hypothetical protein